MKTPRRHEDDDEKSVQNAVVGIEAPLVGIESGPLRSFSLASSVLLRYKQASLLFSIEKKNDRSHKSIT